jgi:hypothetical protein
MSVIFPITPISPPTVCKQIVNDTLKTAKAAHKYLVCTGHNISYSGTIKVMKSMNFHAKIKVKKPLLAKVQKARRLA